MKVRKIKISNIAGYSLMTWDRIQPAMNFLLGRNGAGKTTILQSISLALNYICGKRSEDLLTRTYPNAAIEIELTGVSTPWRFSFKEIRNSQSVKKTGYSFKVLNFVENRQPKNTVGDLRNELRQHSLNRYPNAVSELKLLMSSSESDRKLAIQVIETCKRITTAGTPRDWDWIKKEIMERSSTKARPMSCGQFDIIAFSLDFVRLAASLNGEPVFILMDNPETFLHPSCQEPILELIREMMPQAQIFVASHSLKLLCHREPKSVFWLSRELQDKANIFIRSVCELDDGSKPIFYDLYGDDFNSAVLSLLHSFESPEYYRYLCDCALPPQPILRKNPVQDRQMNVLISHIEEYSDNFAILDYGAENGDLLAALCDWGNTDERTFYVASNIRKSSVLTDRLKKAKEEHKISEDSRIIYDLSEISEDFDVIILCNVCHEIPLSELPKLMASLIQRYLKKSMLSKIIIHEAETLPVGEAGFIVWTPQDFREIFSGIDGVHLQIDRKVLHGSVPLDTTIISFSSDAVAFDRLEELLTNGFRNSLPRKKEENLGEIDSLLQPSCKISGFDEAIRQRRIAFLTAQIAAISLFERKINR